MLSVFVFGASGRSCAFVSHLRQPNLVMNFDVDINVVDRKVLVPGILEKTGGAKVNDVVAGRVAVAVGFCGDAAGADGGGGGG